MSLPPLPDGFEWTQQAWGAALRSIPLGAIAPHLFTTRQLELSSPDDVARLSAAVGARDVAMARQVHGREVVVIREGHAVPAVAPEADVFVSSAPEIAVAILAEMTAVRRGVQIPQTIEPPKAGVEAGCSVPQT